ncbi:hypothetical protein HDU79_007040 [Rhizoclosmatium sp. JEL0117]|nr:hypothetical protein HDU79_007040 [Rhizoclosmatium sp. JEL0117]
MAANDRNALETFRLKTEVSVNAVRQMIDDWLPKEPEKPESKSIRSTEGKPKQSQVPQLYNVFPGEASAKKKKLESKILAKKQEAAAERMAAIVAKEDAEDSRTKTVKAVGEKEALPNGPKPVSTTSTSSGIKRKLGGGSALDKYLNKKKK